MSGLQPLIIPVQAVPSQTLLTFVSNQATQINLHAKNIWVPVNSGIVTDPPVFEERNPIFMDVYLNNAPVVSSVLCRNNTKIIRDSYLGYIGDFAFQDTIGDEDPVYTGLGSRWQLIYWPDLP